MPVGPSGEWTVDMSWFDGDTNGPTRLVLTPTDPENPPKSGISQTVLREIQVSEGVKRAAALADEYAKAAPPLDLDWKAAARLLKRLAADGLTDEYLAALSWAYSAAANQPKPLERLAKLTDKSPAAIKSHLWHATRNGLLQRSPGRKGGAVTEKAVTVLAEMTPKT